MDIANSLDMLRGEFPSCNALVIVDIGAGMPLCASTRLRLPQEQIDALSDTAVVLLGDEAAALTSAPIRMAIVIDGDTAELFLRGADPGTEALCCNLAADTDLPVFAAKGRQILRGLGAGT